MRADPNDRPLLPLGDNIMKITFTIFFQGLVCNPASNKWEWTDGSPVDFKPKLHDPGISFDLKLYRQNNSVLDSACILGVAFHFHTDGGWWLCELNKYLLMSKIFGLKLAYEINESYKILSGSVPGVFPVDVSCTKQLHAPINDDDCDYFESDVDDGVCYQVRHGFVLGFTTEIMLNIFSGRSNS